MAHVRYTSSGDSQEIAAALANVIALRGQVGGLHRAMANAPRLVDGFELFSETIRRQLPLDFGLFALVTLRTVQAQDDRYEWTRCLTIALKAGIPLAKASELWDWANSTLFDARERAALAIVDEHFRLRTDKVPAAQAAKQHLRDEEIVSVCAVMGWFLFCGALTMPLGLIDDDPHTDLAVGINDHAALRQQKDQP